NTTTATRNFTIGCDRSATNASTLASAWSAATAGQVICLAAGSYRTFAASNKAGPVTVRGQGPGSVTMALNFNGATEVIIQHVAITSARLATTIKNIPITHGNFTGAAVINGVANATILVDNITPPNINAPAGSAPERIHLSYSSSPPSGVTVQ